MRPRLATLWLDGCSGCHMSLLDLDERLLEVVERYELVYSPLLDVKEYPESVDVALVEGAVSTEADLRRIRIVRECTRTLVSFGDCAVTGNVPALRNRIGIEAALAVYEVPPIREVPKLLPVLPVHQVVPVDHWLPGCPPAADAIFEILMALLEGRVPAPIDVRFGS
jgi:NAD-reducing hydrogenase small subunit